MNNNELNFYSAELFKLFQKHINCISHAKELLVCALTKLSNVNGFCSDSEVSFQSRKLESSKFLSHWISEIFIRYRELHRTSIASESLTEFQAAKSVLEVASFILQRHANYLNFPITKYAGHKIFNLENELEAQFRFKYFLYSPEQNSKYINSVIIENLKSRNYQKEEINVIKSAFYGVLHLKGNVELKLALGCFKVDPTDMILEFKKYSLNWLTPYQQIAKMPDTLTTSNRYATHFYFGGEL